MEYIALFALAIHIILFVFFSFKMFKNKVLPAHRKSFWFFIFLTTPLFGWLIYINTEGRIKFKGHTK